VPQSSNDAPTGIPGTKSQLMCQARDSYVNYFFFNSSSSDSSPTIQHDVGARQNYA
jgi:hypothetical protein